MLKMECEDDERITPQSLGVSPDEFGHRVYDAILSALIDRLFGSGDADGESIESETFENERPESPE
jgi:hypothetical protein